MADKFYKNRKMKREHSSIDADSYNSTHSDNQQYKKQKLNSPIHSLGEVGSDILSLILDFSPHKLYPAMPHPFYATNTSTRNVYLKHPTSIAHRIHWKLERVKQQLSSNQKMLLYKSIENVLTRFRVDEESEDEKDEESEDEEEEDEESNQEHERNLSQLLKQIDNIQFHEDKDRNSQVIADAKQLINLVTDITMIENHHYDRDIYRFREYNLSFKINEFSFEMETGASADDDYGGHHEVRLPDLAQVKSGTGTSLSVKELEVLFDYLLDLQDVDKYDWEETFD
jgi:hypothetical protein